MNGGGAVAAKDRGKKTKKKNNGDDDIVLAQALFNIKVYVAADKYGVADLQQQAADAFGTALIRASSASASPISGGNNSSSKSSSKASSEAGSVCGTSQPRLTLGALTDIIEEVYNGVSSALPSNRLLRDIVCLVMSHEINALMREPRFVALLDSGSSGIAADAAKGLAKRVNPELKRYLCPVCHGHFETVINVARYAVSCYHCTHYLDGKDWAKHVVQPDLTALWLEHQEKRTKREEAAGQVEQRRVAVRPT